MLAGWDEYLERLPIVGGMVRGTYTDQHGQEVDRAPSADQDVWVGSWLRGLASGARDMIVGEPSAEEDAATRAAVQGAEPGYVDPAPAAAGEPRTATIGF